MNFDYGKLEEDFLEAIEEYESGEEEAGYDADEEEQAQKPNEAEELLRAARERIREK